MNEIEQIHLESKFQAMLDFADEIHSNGLDENIRIELTFLQNQIDKQYNENLEFAEKVKNEQEKKRRKKSSIKTSGKIS